MVLDAKSKPDFY